MQWYCGTAAIAGATSGTLAWASVAASNGGNYQLTVSNAAGAVTSAVATLTVIVPPAITAQPQSQTVIAKTAASLSSAATGSAPLSLQWYCGTMAIAGATNSTLAWASVAASNAGNYQFTVSNSGGRGDQRRRHFDRDRSPGYHCPASISNGHCHNCGVVLVRRDRQRAIVAAMVLRDGGHRGRDQQRPGLG